MLVTQTMAGGSGICLSRSPRTPSPLGQFVGQCCWVGTGSPEGLLFTAVTSQQALRFSVLPFFGGF